MTPVPVAGDDHPEVSLKDLSRVFGLIGISSFGGGLSGWMYRELVEKHKWISPEEFLAGLALARTMPGPNVVNLAIWIGYRMRKGRGAVTAACSVMAGPLILIFAFAVAYGRLGQSLTTHQVLLGVTTAALGLNLSACILSFRAAAKTPFYAIIALLVFAGVVVMHWSILPVVGVLGTSSVVWAFFVDRPDAR